MFFLNSFTSQTGLAFQLVRESQSACFQANNDFYILKTCFAKPQSNPTPLSLCLLFSSQPISGRLGGRELEESGCTCVKSNLQQTLPLAQTPENTSPKTLAWNSTPVTSQCSMGSGFAGLFRTLWVFIGECPRRDWAPVTPARLPTPLVGFSGIFTDGGHFTQHSKERARQLEAKE